MNKIISLNNLIKILNTKYQILNTVLVTGCFDVLHPAHTDFLKTAKDKGDLLIIGLESDNRLRELKGKIRPINNQQVRAKNLAMLNPIDFIFPLPEKFTTEKDHLHLLQLIKPQILAISEHDKNLNQKKKLIEKVGGKLFVFPFDNKYSTTKIITNRII